MRAVPRSCQPRPGRLSRLVYELTLRFSLAPEAVGGGAADDAPSIFTALREQLGLTLEPATAPLPVLVIDRIERPSEN
jgi:uncharacterized protein (TIGR03435 family)